MEGNGLDGMCNIHNVQLIGSPNMPHIDGENDLNNGEKDMKQKFLLNVTKETVMHMEFGTLEDAKQFYKKYAHVKRFGVKLDDIYRNK